MRFLLRHKPKPVYNNGKTLLDFNRGRRLEVVAKRMRGENEIKVSNIDLQDLVYNCCEDFK